MVKAPSKTKPKNILVVDDSKTFITYMTYLLRKMGFRKIIIAEDGKEALRILEMWTPDIVILDVSMRIMGGIETLREIKKDNYTSKLPVIMVSSSAKHKKECLELGCAAFLRKPIKVSALNNALQDTLEKTGVYKRSHIRTKFKEKIPVTHEGKTKTYDSETLSEGGIYIKKSPPYPVGTELEVTIPYKKEKPIRLKGTVIYIKETEDIPHPLPIGMAIQFKKMSKATSKLLSGYVMEIITGKQKT